MKSAALTRASLIPACLAISFLFGAVPAIAQDAKATPIRDVLSSQVGKRVAVVVDGAKEIEGTVTSVGSDTVVLAKISGKDFLDSVVVISKISAVTYKAREK